MAEKTRKIIAKAVFLLIQGVKIFFQIPNGSCRFSPTCSEFAREAIEKKHPILALVLITKRILKCHPFHKREYDPLEKNSISTKGVL